MRANVIYANALLRRGVGGEPQVQRGFSPTAVAKLGFARMAKAARRAPERSAPPPSFILDAKKPGVLLPL